jgi:hypothetical protein
MAGVSASSFPRQHFEPRFYTHEDPRTVRLWTADL